MAEQEGGLEHLWGLCNGNRSKWLGHCSQRHPQSHPMPAPILKLLQQLWFSVLCGWCCWFATRRRECSIWALGALWTKQAWPERFEVEKGHLPFAGEQPFEGISPLHPLLPRSHPALQPRPLPAFCIVQGKYVSPFALGSTSTQLPARAWGRVAYLERREDPKSQLKCQG